MEFVVNEWLPEYFKPSAPEEERRKLMLFFQLIYQRDDMRIIVRRPSPFLSKLYRIEKDYINDPLAVQPVKTFIRLIIQNSNKCRFVDDEEINPLPDQLVELLNVGNYSSDTYLFEAACTLPNNRVIVTTDEKLKRQVNGKVDFNLMNLDEFLANFVN